MHYTLMHKEIPVVDIELDDASGAITRVDDVHNAAHIPIGIAYKNDILDRKALNKWWYGRSQLQCENRFDVPGQHLRWLATQKVDDHRRQALPH